MDFVSETIGGWVVASTTILSVITISLPSFSTFNKACALFFCKCQNFYLLPRGHTTPNLALVTTTYSTSMVINHPPSPKPPHLLQQNPTQKCRPPAPKVKQAPAGATYTAATQSRPHNKYSWTTIEARSVLCT
ncbi:hypothetical protein P175DRAFT_0371907 [Aspergillus ochraceoroseus IBT 24754]|uniref:Uncharacterized protein n=1 Tax=Aspergillus ochraceoroseus IBT 24754 TaxID=1392256 RepID=A0A2T5LN10_9EURO|nr:uncharacterized protein P175DRAFT_0371907 [Aspergillus ochraceoroseus IBT 24754]PTU17657.1 hypothetical protein P175DRAFT_0371907 [Aspergillus ochraceoroseus IBT 24754]